MTAADGSSGDKLPPIFLKLPLNSDHILQIAQLNQHAKLILMLMLVRFILHTAPVCHSSSM